MRRVLALRPQGARLVHADGSSTPLELAYVGRDEEDGMHVWEAVTPLREGDALHVDVMPGRSSIRIPAS